VVYEMTVYVREVSSVEPRFQGRSITITGESLVTTIPVPNTVVLCNGCNQNIYPNNTYLVYLSKNDVKMDRPYDCYCWDCIQKHWKKNVKMV